MIEKNPILKSSIDFAILVTAFCEILNSNKQFIISKQLTRSATSIGANAMEAQNCESKAAFIHKIKISAKEAAETHFWLLLCERNKNFANTEILQNKLIEIQKILNSILGTATRKTPISYFS